jgi:hypothetical protein
MASDSTRVYWTEFGDGLGTPNGSVKSCPVAGCGSGPLVYASGQMNPRGIAVDGQNVYWGTSSNSGVTGAIWSCPIAGCMGGAMKLSDAVIPEGIALDATFVYWVDIDNYTANRVPKAGGGGGSQLWDASSGGVSTPLLCAVDNAFLYFTDDSAGVYRVPLTGGNPIVLAPTTGIGAVWPVVLDSNSVYYGANGQIVRAYKTATDGGVPLVTTVPSPDGLVIDTTSGLLYWSDWGSGLANDGTVGKVKAAGGNSTLVASSLVTPSSLALSGNYVAWISYGTLDDAGGVFPGTGTLLRNAK